MNRLGLVISLFLLSGIIACGNAQTPDSSVTFTPEISVKDIGESYIELKSETHSQNNCDGSDQGMVISRDLSQEQTISFQSGVGGKVGVEGGIPQTVKAQVEASVSAAVERAMGVQDARGVRLSLKTDPGYIREHTLVWEETVVPGVVDIIFSEGNRNLAFTKVIAIRLKDRTSVDIPCTGEISSGDAVILQEPTNTPEIVNDPLPTNTPVPQSQSVSVQSTNPFREHRDTPVVGSGALTKGTYSDGMAPYSESDVVGHLNIQRVRLEENPDGCAIAFLDANQIWFGSAVKTALTINDAEVGEINGATGKHGYVFDVPIRKGDKICVTYFEPSGFHIIFGPDMYYHYDSYCYRGNC